MGSWELGQNVVNSITDEFQLRYVGGTRVANFRKAFAGIDTSEFRGAMTVNVDGQGSAPFRIKNGSAGDVMYVNTSSSMVGINKSSASHTLDVQGDVACGDVILGISGQTYCRVDLNGGNARGHIYGNFGAHGDGIRMSYNYYVNNAGTEVIPNAAGANLYLHLGYGGAKFGASIANSAPYELGGWNNDSMYIGTNVGGAKLHVAAGTGTILKLTGYGVQPLVVTSGGMVDFTGSVDTYTGNSLRADEKIRITSQTSPSSSATGSVGEIRVDGNYIYVCTATDTWKRAALSTF